MPGAIVMHATTITTRAISLSWIPSEVVTGVPEAAFEIGFTHYDAADGALAAPA